MKVIAPGKLLLTGAYAVLDGARALVVAVDRYAVADAGEPVDASLAMREVRAAFGSGPTPSVDVRALYEGDAKLGIGSSAAALVAALGARAAARGEDVQTARARSAIFDAARRAHAEAQGGGSGVDIAASAYGGVLAYARAGNAARVEARALPDGLALGVIWSGTSARTSDLRARVDALRARDSSAYDRAITALGDASERAVAACEAGARGVDSLDAFLDAALATGDALAALGRASDAPIVPPAFAALASEAKREGAALMPSGAGGGDVAVFLGRRPPSPHLVSCIHASGMRPLAIGIDRGGVRPLGKVEQD